jgi:hypothetical protein
MMEQPGLRLRHIVFHGPGRLPASLLFGPGLNVIYGASEVGKSFVVEAIDFMLGGKPPLRDIPERVGYDRVLLGLRRYRARNLPYYGVRKAERSEPIRDYMLTCPVMRSRRSILPISTTKRTRQTCQPISCRDALLMASAFARTSRTKRTVLAFAIWRGWLSWTRRRSWRDGPLSRMETRWPRRPILRPSSSY